MESERDGRTAREKDRCGTARAAVDVAQHSWIYRYTAVTTRRRERHDWRKPNCVEVEPGFEYILPTGSTMLHRYIHV